MEAGLTSPSWPLSQRCWPPNPQVPGSTSHHPAHSQLAQKGGEVWSKLNFNFLGEKPQG